MIFWADILKSLGEYTALAIANALSLEDMLRIVAGRAKLMTTLCEPASSTMIACRLSPTEAEKMIEEHPGLSKFSVACRNSSNDCVLAGPLDDIATLEESFRNQVKATKLDVPYGFHSVAMDPIVEPLKELGKSSTWMHPTIPVASNVLGRLIKPGELSHDYFARHARHTVRFEDAARDVMAHGFLKNTVWLEIGPHPTTLPMIRSMLNSSSSTCVPTLRRDLAAWASLSTSLSQLFLYIDTIDWRKVFGSSQAKMTQLPGYPLRGTTHGVLYREISSGLVDGESEVSESQKKTAFQLLPTLRVPQSAEHRHVFETSTERLAPLILGHEVGGTSICPASVFIELALEAATTVWKVYENEVLVVQNLNFHHPLVCVSKGNPRSVSVQLSGEGLQPHTEFRVTSEGTDGASDTDHCTGLISTMQTSELKDRWLKEAAIINRQSKYILTLSDGSINHFKRKTLYESIFTRVVRYSDDFQGLSDFSVSESSLEGLGSFRVPAKAQRDNLVVPPVFTDTLLHAAGFIANLYTKPEEISICVHVGMTEILYRELDDEESFTVYCSLFENSKGAIIADAFAINPAGAVVASVGGMEFKKLRLSTFQRLLSGSQTPTEPAKQDKEVDEDQVMANKIARTASSKHITSSETQLRPHQPHQDVRQIVARIFSEVCQTSENDLDYAAPLDTYGIDSLMQIEIAARLKQAFPKQHIDQNILFDGKSLTALEQTITDLVSKEANDQSCSSSSTPGSRNDATYGSSPSPVSPGRERSSSSTSASDVVPSNPVACHISKGGATPLYLFHDGSGSMRMYTAIQAFDRTTYAFFDPHILDIKAPFTRLDHMAQDYISHLSLSRNEPIILGGKLQSTSPLLRLHPFASKLPNHNYQLTHSPLPSRLVFRWRPRLGSSPPAYHLRHTRQRPPPHRRTLPHRP